MQKFQKNINKIGLRYDTKQRIIYTTKNDVHYEITEENLRKYEFYYNRYLFSFTLALLISIMNIYIALSIGVISVIVLEILFRNFLAKCNKIENFVPHQSKNRQAPSKSQLITLGLVYLVLGALLLIFTFYNDTDDKLIYLSYGISIFACFLGIKSLLSINKH